MAAHDATQVRECMGKFTALETKMATITNSDGTGTLDRLNEEFFNHDGRPGLKSQFMLYLQSQKTMREENDKRLKDDADKVSNALTEHNRRADRKVNIVIAVCAFLTLIFGFPAVLSTIVEVRRELFHNELHLPKLFTPKHIGQLYEARVTQDATNQPLYTRR